MTLKTLTGVHADVEQLRKEAIQSVGVFSEAVADTVSSRYVIHEVSRGHTLLFLDPLTSYDAYYSGSYVW